MYCAEKYQQYWNCLHN